MRTRFEGKANGAVCESCSRNAQQGRLHVPSEQPPGAAVAFWMCMRNHMRVEMEHKTPKGPHLAMDIAENSGPKAPSTSARS